MRVYRICNPTYPALDGKGAQEYGGRWNTPGRPLVYTSSSLALAALEALVHYDAADSPADLVALTIEIPDDTSQQLLSADALPRGWEREADSPACAAVGDAWLVAALTLTLHVPAAPVPEELNVLINPVHPEAARVRVVARRPFFFDPRLVS